MEINILRASCLLTTILLIGCKETPTDSISKPIITQSTTVFCDSAAIGVPGKNRVELSSRISKQTIEYEINFYTLCDNGWTIIENSDFTFNANSFLTPILDDYNNDGLMDLYILSNLKNDNKDTLGQLFIYNSVSNQLDRIDNSLKYPNLQISESKDCLTSYSIKGEIDQCMVDLFGSTEFLNIDRDSIKIKAVINQYFHKKVTKWIDSYGIWKSYEEINENQSYEIKRANSLDLIRDKIQ